jgi:uncharacterized membrane protein
VVTVIYAVVGILRLTRFDMTAYDAGIFDNVLWRLSHLYNDVSAITGSHHFSDHMSPLLLLAVPIYAVVPHFGLPILMIAQAVSVGLVGLAAWLLAEHLDLSPELRRAGMLVTLLGAGAYNAAVIDIHEVGLAVGPIAMTTVLAIRGTRLSRYWIWPMLAALARVDIAITVVLIGVLLRKDHPAHARVTMWIGGIAAVAMAGWLIGNPWDGTSFAYHFAHLGVDSAGGLPAAAMRDPVAALRPLVDPTMWGSLTIWLIGFMVFAPLRAAKWILPAAPTLLIPVLGSWEQADLAHLHYWHVLLPMLAVATMIGLASFEQLKKKAVYVAALAVLLSWAFMPLLKPSFGTSLEDERAVVAFLEVSYPDASVAAIGNLVPHVSTRPEVMQLPMPFACPTVPLAAFRGPESPPQLVTIPISVLDDPLTPAAATVADTVRDYYRPIASFGRIEVWQLAREIPVSSYDVVCDAGVSENSS